MRWLMQALCGVWLHDYRAVTKLRKDSWIIRCQRCGRERRIDL